MKLSVVVLCCVALAVLTTSACAQCTVSAPWGTINLSQIPVATLNIKQLYQGYATAYTYVFSLCQAVSWPPAGGTACNEGPGYVSEYGYTTNKCETAWTTQTSLWAFDARNNAVWATFVNPKGWPMTVYVACGTTMSLRNVGDVEVSDSLSFTVNLTSSAICGPTPNPAPRPPPNPPLTPVPQPPPPPAPPRPTDQLVQSVCSDPKCASCLNSTTPLGVCVPSLTGGSLIAACTSSSAILTIFPFSTSCTGAANVTQLPLNQCSPNGLAGAEYVKNTCTAFRAP